MSTIWADRSRKSAALKKANKALGEHPNDPVLKQKADDAKKDFDAADRKVADDKGNFVLTRCVNSTTATAQVGGQQQTSMTQGTISYTNMEYDPYYKRGPACVICTDFRRGRGGINKELAGGWLHWRALPGASPLRKADNAQVGDIPLGVHGHYEFFVAPGQATKVPKFALFILAGATQSDTITGGGGGGATKPSTATAVNAGTGNLEFFQAPPQ